MFIVSFISDVVPNSTTAFIYNPASLPIRHPPNGSTHTPIESSSLTWLPVVCIAGATVLTLIIGYIKRNTLRKR